MIFWQHALIIVACTVVNDYAWAIYIRRVASGRALEAGFWASTIFLSGIVLTLGAISDYRLIVVAAVSTFFGTTFTVRRDHGRTDSSPHS